MSCASNVLAVEFDDEVSVLDPGVGRWAIAIHMLDERAVLFRFRELVLVEIADRCADRASQPTRGDAARSRDLGVSSRTHPNRQYHRRRCRLPHGACASLLPV